METNIIEESSIQNVILVGVHINQTDLHNFEYSMKELKNLSETCYLHPVETIVQNLDRPTNSFYVGRGKVEEIKEAIEKNDATMVIFNDELSPSHIKNLEEKLECKIIDRTMLILEIFAKRANTRMAKLQVEHAQLKYYKPRIMSLQSSFSRQQGGIGTKGPGEKKIELDRRRIEDQITKIKHELDDFSKVLHNQRKKRIDNSVPTASLVGYTNAGKSTTMNRILEFVEKDESKKVFEKDMLFATLDTSTRNVKLANKKEFNLVDTIGFVSKLPHHLVTSFESTFAEITDADLLIHIIDASDINYLEHKDITTQLIGKLKGNDIPIITVYNKYDIVDTSSFELNSENEIFFSAKTGFQLEEFLELIIKNLFKDNVRTTLVVPYSDGKTYSELKEKCEIFSENYVDGGIEIDVSLSKYLYSLNKKYEK